MTFPAFGRFVVEAAAEQGNSPGDAAGVFSHPDSFFRIGAVDVNVACGTADDGDAPDEANFGLQFFILPCGDDGDEEISF